MSLARQFGIGTAPEIKRTAAKPSPKPDVQRVAQQSAPKPDVAQRVVELEQRVADLERLVVGRAQAAESANKKSRAAYYREYRERSK